jgi:tetratricopeptide (TPR) repeat protein
MLHARRKIPVLKQEVIMKSDRLIPLMLLVVFFSIACNSRKASQGAQSGPSSAQPNTSSSPPPTADNSTGQGISYAKNPERFVKAPTVVPPFNLTNPKTATDFFDVGVHEDNLHHYDKAIAAYQEALKLKPDWPLLCMRQAKDYQHMNQRDKAIAQLRQATRIDPHYWDAYSEMALIYKDAGDTKHAIEAASRLLAFEPMQIPVHNQLGYWYEETGDRQKARQEFEIYRDLAAHAKTEKGTERYEAALRELQKLSD